MVKIELPPVMRVFRDRLQLTLAKSRVSQAQLARIARLNPTHVNNLCNGRRTRVSAQTVVAIARALGCSTDWLLGLAAIGPKPIAVRQSIGVQGGRVMQYIGDERIDPINQNLGVVSRRGLVRGRPPVPPPEDDDGADHAS